MHVGRFGEIEYWFALIKVVAIIVFIAVGAALIFGIGTHHPIGLSNLTANGGFLPHGWLGVWLALTLVVTSYMGVEVIAVTAGEAENPEKSIPESDAHDCLPADFLLRPRHHRHARHDALESDRRWHRPHRQSFRSCVFLRRDSVRRHDYEYRGHHRGALELQHGSVSHHAHAFLSRARQDTFPRRFRNWPKNGVPRRALAVSSAGMVAAILLAIYAPGKAFLALYGVAVAGMFFVWVVILLTHISFRRALGRERIAKLPMRSASIPIRRFSASRLRRYYDQHVFRRWIAMDGPGIRSISRSDHHCILVHASAISRKLNLERASQGAGR